MKAKLLECALVGHNWGISANDSNKVNERYFTFQCETCGISVKFPHQCVCDGCKDFYIGSIKDESSQYYGLPIKLLKKGEKS